MADDMLDRLFRELASTDIPVPARASVVARGLRRRRRARALTVTVTAAACVLVGAGAAQFAGGGHAGTRPLSRHGIRHPAVCTAAPDAALTAELAQQLPISIQSGVWPLAVSADVSLVYAETTVPGFHGIVAESLATGAILTKIKALPASYTGAQGGLGPGGELIWTNTYSTHRGQGTPGTTPVRLWSPRTGRMTALEPAGQHGGWTVNDDASYLAGASSLAAARITALGEEFSAGSRVLVMGWSGKKKQPASNPFWLFSGSVINTLRCAAPAKPGSR
jgi:hypothetical protein